MATIGGIPTPPPIRSGILFFVISKPFPIGPITESISPIFLSASCLVPSPTILYRRSNVPFSMSTDITEIGLRIASMPETDKWTNWPGRVTSAISFDSSVRIYCSASNL